MSLQFLNYCIIVSVTSFAIRKLSCSYFCAYIKYIYPTMQITKSYMQYVVCFSRQVNEIKDIIIRFLDVWTHPHGIYGLFEVVQIVENKFIKVAIVSFLI